MNLESLAHSSGVLLALAATLFTWGMTALGSAMVFFFKEIRAKTLNMMLGFASGVMIAASFFSLLLPAESMAEELGMTPWLVMVVGFLGGAGSDLFTGDNGTLPERAIASQADHGVVIACDGKATVKNTVFKIDIVLAPLRVLAGLTVTI